MEDNQNWNKRAIKFFYDVKKEIDSSVKYTGRGENGRFEGVFPQKYVGVISPSKDPISFNRGKHVLELDDFLLPDLYVHYPEAQFGDMFANAVPPCKWCGTSSCVMRDGWMTLPRRAHARTRNIAILGRKYYCSVRQKNGMKPFNFRGIDKEVIEKSPDYVKMRWRMDGFDLSHKSAIALSLLRDARAAVVQGLSLNGFRHTLLQSQQEYHLMLSIQWRFYVDHIRRNPRILPAGVIDSMHQDFPDFDSDQYNQDVLSVSWLISRVIKLMESDEEYKRKRMQIMDGKHLSGDHSFKLTKCVISGGSKPFTAIYLIMNEFGQVVAWWFTSGTSMIELQSAISNIKTRYEKYGYDGPVSFTTDRCCQERAFWVRVLKLVEGRLDTQFLEAEDVSEVEVVKAPNVAQVAQSIAMCNLFVGWISEEINKLPMEQRVIIVDGEWKIGHAKMDVLIIGMPFTYKVYIFQLTKMCRNRTDAFPLQLKLLLQDSTVKKIGNRICTDVSKLKAWNVIMNPTQDLGHLAFDRALVSTRAPSLATLIDVLFPGVEVEGKNEGANSARISDWSADDLTEEQVRYANNDGYSPSVVYRALMQIMDPKVQARILAREVTDGLQVTFYSNKWKTRVVEGIIRGSMKARGQVDVEIDIAKKKNYLCSGHIRGCG